MIIGLTGRNAAGKGAVSDYLKDKLGFRYTSLSDIIRAELRAKNMEVTRDNLIYMGNHLRTEHGPNYLARRTLEVIADAQKNGPVNYCVDSIRSPFEVEALRASSAFTLLGVDAPARIRYERLLSRARPGDSMQTFEQFLEFEQRENVAAATNQQLDVTFALADIVVDNGGTLEELHQRVDKVLAEIKAKK